MHFTQNPIGSDDQLDLQDNAISFDYAMNSPAALWEDRFGKQHKTVQQALKDVGFKPAGFDFVSGGTLGIGDRDKCIFYPTDGYWYSWNGKLPYVVPANSSPTPGGKKGWGVVTRDERVIAREALRRTYLEAGLNLVEGSFEEGAVLVNVNDVLLQERTGKVFSGPAGAVAAGTNPAGGGFVDRSDITAGFAGVYRRYTTVVQTMSGEFPVGARLALIDRGGADFDVVAGGVANGFDILDAGNGNTAEIVDRFNLSPEMMGYVSGDCAQYFNALHAAAENGFNCILKPNHLYTATSSILWSGKDANIVGNGSTLSFSDGYFLQEGTAQDGGVTVSVTANKGGDTITLSTSTHGFVAGDVLMIWNPVAFSFCGHREYYRDGEFNTVLSVSGSVVRLTDPIRSTYPAADSVKVIKMVPIRVTAENFTVIGNAALADAWRIRLAVGSELKNCSSYSGRDNSLRLDRCYKFDSHGGTFECKTPAGFLQYGVFVGNSQMVNFYKPRLHGTRHALATGGQADLGSVPNRDIFVREANASSDLIWSLDMHGNIENGQFIDCVTNRGVGLAGIDAAVIGGTHSRPDESPIQFGEVVGGTYRIKDLSLDVSTLAAIRANNSDLLYEVTKNMHFCIENIKVGGSGAFETLALLSYGWKSGTDWTVTVRDIIFTGSLPAAVVRLNKLTRPDAGNVPQPLSVVVSDVANVPTTSKWCELLGVAWVQGVTRFTLPSQSINVPVSITSGQFLGADSGFSFTKYPTTPCFSVRYSGNAFSGNTTLFTSIKSATAGSAIVNINTASTTLTAGANASGNAEINVHMNRLLF